MEYFDQMSSRAIVERDIEEAVSEAWKSPGRDIVIASCNGRCEIPDFLHRDSDDGLPQGVILADRNDIEAVIIRRYGNFDGEVSVVFTQEGKLLPVMKSVIKLAELPTVREMFESEFTGGIEMFFTVNKPAVEELPTIKYVKQNVLEDWSYRING